jgi:uroporphyrinogen-III synthase
MATQSRPRILITRPRGQQARFLSSCLSLGVDAVHWPCIIIDAVHDNNVAAKLSNITQAVLFTSTNAVHRAHQIRPFPWPDAQVYAIGAASARALAELKQSVVAAPRAPYNSESTLALLLETDLTSLLIIKGRGGRTLIQDTLVNHGWKVTSLDVYQRRSPSFDEADAQSIFGSGMFDLVSIGSDEVLMNLMNLTQAWHDQLLETQLIVNSQRCVALATEFGFRHSPLIAEPAGDEGQLRCVRHWLDKHQQVSSS